MVALSASEIFSDAHMRDAIEHAHVVGIVAAEQHVVGADLPIMNSSAGAECRMVS